MARKDIPDKMVLVAYQICRITDGYPYELLIEWTGQPFKVCYRAMERADERGYIDWGVSLRTGWLTDKGRELLDLESDDARA